LQKICEESQEASMTTLSVGPTSSFPTIAAAMLAASAGDTILLETGYGNELAVVTHNGLIISGDISSTGIDLQLATGIALLTLAGTAAIDVIDAADSNTIVGNDGDNTISVSSGVDVVNAGAGNDRLIVDYSAATVAITGTPVGITDGATHAVTFTGVENFTIATGSGADTITVGDGINIISGGGLPTRSRQATAPTPLTADPETTLSSLATAATPSMVETATTA
jgi:Ca2+-binding RTX toxin-like protein